MTKGKKSEGLKNFLKETAIGLGLLGIVNFSNAGAQDLDNGYTLHAGDKFEFEAPKSTGPKIPFEPRTKELAVSGKIGAAYSVHQDFEANGTRIIGDGVDADGKINAKYYNSLIVPYISIEAEGLKRSADMTYEGAGIAKINVLGNKTNVGAGIGKQTKFGEFYAGINQYNKNSNSIIDIKSFGISATQDDILSGIDAVFNYKKGVADLFVKYADSLKGSIETKIGNLVTDRTDVSGKRTELELSILHPKVNTEIKYEREELDSNGRTVRECFDVSFEKNGFGFGVRNEKIEDGNYMKNIDEPYLKYTKRFNYNKKFGRK